MKIQKSDDFLRFNKIMPKRGTVTTCITIHQVLIIELFPFSAFPISKQTLVYLSDLSLVPFGVSKHYDLWPTECLSAAVFPR